MRSKKEHLLCSPCAVKQAKEHSFHTLFFGWWGIPVGPIASFIALFGNAMSASKLGSRANSLWVIAFTPIVLPVLLVGAIIAMPERSAGASESNQAVAVGEKEFHSANGLILGHTKGTHHGNTEEAKKLAESFSGRMASMEKIFFKGGKENRAFSLTNEQFLTYCQIADEAVVFLVHVPQFKRYKGDVRDMLITIAWSAAESVAAEHRPDEEIQLVLGLRGSLLYGGSAVGLRGNDPKTRNEAAIDHSFFYPFFGPAPKPEVVEPTVPSPETVVIPEAESETSAPLENEPKPDLPPPQ